MRLRVYLVVLCAFLPLACGGREEPVRVGSKTFTENIVLGDLLAFALQQHEISSVHKREVGGTQVVWNALLRGDLDAYVEYTGTLMGETLVTEHLSDFDALKRSVEGRGIHVSRPLGFNNTYALGMLRSRAKALGIRTVSDLTAHADLRLGFSNEFVQRLDGWKGLRTAYALPQGDVTGIAHALSYKALESGAVDVIDLYTTDGEIERYDILALEDDRHFFPRYDAVILWRSDVVKRYPAFPSVVSQLEGTIDERAMTKLNARVKLGGEREAMVAASFLREQFGYDVEVEGTTLVERVLSRTGEHLALVLVSLLAAILVAIPLGVLATRWPKAGQGILGVVGVLQTVPSLALLVFMIPFLGVGTAPAAAALFLYSLLPIVRNTHAGLSGIPRDLLESAEVLGLKGWARLRLVELPLALPSILAGIQTSAVINVGTATLGAFIGAGGYGQPILAGIRRDDVPTILEGAIPAAVLALVAQGAFELLERVLVPRGLRARAAD